MAAIELSGVVKRFGPITAVDGLDLDVPEGICAGLVGPNGAGKSTTMRLLTGQAIANGGELRVLGHELPGESKSARAEMGVVPPLDNLDVDVTVEENLAVLPRPPRAPAARRPRGGPPGRSPPASTGSRTSAPPSTAASTWPACATVARTPSTSSQEGCAGGCCWPAASSTNQGWSCSTSPPSDSTRRSAPRSGP